uniref:Uncharacterized protein n=1 Tax=Arcella intermedia TaxID=1963864 RepID=A0A6B2L6Y9_9EUKA
MILHFDINKTIIISDPAGGKSVSECINGIIGEVVWGTKKALSAASADELKVSLVIDQWVWVPHNPRVVSVTDPSDGSTTFANFLHETLKYPPKTGTKEEQYKVVHEIKKKRDELTTTFTNPGKVGNMCRDLYDMLHKGLCPDVEINGVKTTYEVYLLPSFLNLVTHLANQKRKFTIIFRTFGTDIEPVIKAFNLFCEGKHPMYPNVRYNQLPVDLRLTDELKPTNLGFIFHKEESGTESLHLNIGTITKEDSKAQLSGFKDIHQFFIDSAERSLKSGGSLAIRDDYYWWASHNESAHAGKCNIFNPKDPQHHTIFLDDNYFPNRGQSILDCRDQNGEALPDSVAEAVYAIKVEPFDAISNPQYFIQVIQKAEEKRAKLLATQ